MGGTRCGAGVASATPVGSSSPQSGAAEQLVVGPQRVAAPCDGAGRLSGGDVQAMQAHKRLNTFDVCTAPHGHRRGQCARSACLLDPVRRPEVDDVGCREPITMAAPRRITLAAPDRGSVGAPDGDHWGRPVTVSAGAWDANGYSVLILSPRGVLPSGSACSTTAPWSLSAATAGTFERSLGRAFSVGPARLPSPEAAIRGTVRMDKPIACA